MALLHYEKLGLPQPELTLENTFLGLRDFYEYVKRTIEYPEQETTVLHLAWVRAGALDGPRAPHEGGRFGGATPRHHPPDDTGGPGESPRARAGARGAGELPTVPPHDFLPLNTPVRGRSGPPQRQSSRPRVTRELA